jgi:TolB protein
MKIPIHVEDFVYEGNTFYRFPTGESAEEVLVRDLEYSDFFIVTRGAPAPSSTGSAPTITQGTEANRVTAAASGARAIASAKVHSSWNRIVLSGALRDGTSGNRIFTKDYVLGEPPDRWTIHAFADDIVLYMTGERGVAQTRIAFVQGSGRQREIHLIDYDGQHPTQLTNLKTIVLSPSWAPGGERLAFTSFGHGQAAVVGWSLRDRRTWTVSPKEGMAASPAWSPDGRKIAFTRCLGGNIEIFLADAGGGNPVRLTQHPAIDTSPTFSPDGNSIAFTSDRSGQTQIYVMDREGANLRRLTFTGKQNDSPDWSPKGDRIAFISVQSNFFDICTMRPDGGDLQRLTGEEGMHENPRWAPDGRHIVYSKLHRGERRLHVMASDGSGKRVLTSGKGDQYNPAWSPAMSLQSPRGDGSQP